MWHELVWVLMRLPAGVSGGASCAVGAIGLRPRAGEFNPLKLAQAASVQDSGRKDDCRPLLSVLFGLCPWVALAVENATFGGELLLGKMNRVEKQVTAKGFVVLTVRPDGDTM
jgi:hypothetical protein